MSIDRASLATRARLVAGRAGGQLSPGRRRWRRFLADLPLDVDSLPRPLPAPGPDDFIVCGCPRSGTTLLASVLWQPPTSLVAMEPWDGMRLPPAELFASLRQEMATTGQLARGKLNLPALLDQGEVEWVPEGETVAAVAYEAGTKVGVKWPAWWQFVPLLPDTRFLVCVRNPFAVIGSFKKQGGRLIRGLEYDIAFNKALNRRLGAVAASDAERRIALYDAVNAALLPYLDRPNVLVVKYERWASDAQGLRTDISQFLGIDIDAGPAIIRMERPASRLGEEELDLVRRTCRTGAALGYDLESLPQQAVT